LEGINFDPNSPEMLALWTIILLLFLEAHHNLSTLGRGSEEVNDVPHDGHMFELPDSSNSMATVAAMTSLRHFRLNHSLTALDEDLGF